MLQSKTVTYTAPDLTAAVTVTRASVLRSMRRRRLAKSGLTYETDDPDLRLLRWLFWPAVKAGTRGGTITFIEYDEDGKPTVAPALVVPISELTFDQFAELPEDLIAEWYAAVLDLNPHWSAREPGPEPGSAEGKASSADAETTS